MLIKDEQDIRHLKEIGKVVAVTLDTMRQNLRPGITTKKLDEIGGKTLASFGAQSAPIKCYGFPGHTCISINEEAAHGIPSKRKIRAGDLVNIDVSAELNGYFSDTGGTFPVEVKDPNIHRLCETARRALKRAVEKIKPDMELGVLRDIYEEESKEQGFELIRNLCGHGVGKKLHEPPEYVPDFSLDWDTKKLADGQVVAIEPFFSTGHPWVVPAQDGWTLMGPKGQFSAQFEHTVIVTHKETIILTQVP